MIYHVGITRYQGAYQIAIHKTHHDFMIANAELRVAKNVEELLEIVESVYDPPLPWVAIEGLETLEEHCRRLDIVPGEEK